MDRLYPEFKGRLRVCLLNTQHIHAFALPNGSIYVNAGLVARFTHRHSLQQAERGDSARAAPLLRHYLERAPGAADCAYVEYSHAHGNAKSGG